MAWSVQIQEARDWAESYDNKLLATDPRFRNCICVVHQDGSVFSLRHSFLIVLNNEWVVCFSEHNGFFVWSKDDLEIYRCLQQVELEAIDIKGMSKDHPS